tara:strand:+ start:878 stop:1648 length:771 start_codon:yes stop_codon:yes gene_type:complete
VTNSNLALEVELSAKIVRATTAYNIGKPCISNKAFDALVNNLHSINPNNKILKTPFGGNKLSSLDNARLEEWYRGIRKNTDVVIEPKIDGVALAVQYQYGELQLAYTRSGRDVTRYAYEVPNIPKTITEKKKITIRGELYAFDEPAPKSQRIAAAQLRRKEPDCKLLSFIAFQILDRSLDHLDQISHLDTLKFITNPYKIRSDYDGIKDLHNQWLSGQLWNNIPTDGIVAKINDRHIQKTLGQSEKCPQWALALKN